MGEELKGPFSKADCRRACYETKARPWKITSSSKPCYFNVLACVRLYYAMPTLRKQIFSAVSCWSDVIYSHSDQGMIGRERRNTARIQRPTIVPTNSGICTSSEYFWLTRCSRRPPPKFDMWSSNKPKQKCRNAYCINQCQNLTYPCGRYQLCINRMVHLNPSMVFRFARRRGSHR